MSACYSMCGALSLAFWLMQAATLMDKRLVCTIDSWPADSQYPLGHYVRALGQIGDKDTETEVRTDQSSPCLLAAPVISAGKGTAVCLSSALLMAHTVQAGQCVYALQPFQQRLCSPSMLLALHAKSLPHPSLGG